jgi:hypothetical protein
MWLILTLLIAIIIAGFVIRSRYDVYLLVLVSPTIALICAMATWLGGLTSWRGFVTVFACVITMQLAYMVVSWLRVGRKRSRQEPRHDAVGNHALDHYDVRLLSLDTRKVEAVAALPAGEASHSSQFLIRRRAMARRADKKINQSR